MVLAVGRLLYLYVGTSDTAKAVQWWVAQGARKIWHFDAFGAQVAAVEPQPGGPGAPQVLLADHRKPGTVLPIYEVPDLAAAKRDLQAAKADWTDPGFETPNGPCILVRDPGGFELCLLEMVRPDAPREGGADKA